MHYVYILKSKKDRGLYIGFSNDLRRRMNQHKEGKVIATKNRRPLSLIYYEAFSSIDDAKVREEYLKSGYGRKNLKAMLKNSL
ncbi:MAG: excinuclease ABC subunit C [Candidatus Nealsonbacteria bacterium CG23_combo_of_CG06-09_8_20_14_all_40_13]|uniref:Excinuclease ABC subunit C n=1 Tax=Candidatus Nealsonbacteria bacterium CG23_combo_of_CG06-09_8_20_14_all_40_13 TaxID=1974724 RepID=A0A2G9YR93_9BACT|nr:MAG: excinuclease ABC subunit C [Candidatus Nealsonbacteria bacterium CG23_combo_of_CG06-09_8_20_14_all_40_13]PIU43176.1 MAG: excinuclease ABC subunit C [Candidatus Nealsonbacteria bacterium CG07_land_8_20_14_0_80_40_10]